MKRVLFYGICLCMIGCQQSAVQLPQGAYIGSLRPDTTAAVFAANWISTGLNERDAAWTPNASEFYFTVWQQKRGSILVSKQQGENWSVPEVASFSGRYNDVEPFVTHDGQRLYFASNRPLEPNGKTKDYDIWVCHRIGTTWSSPEKLGSPVNTDADEFYPTLTNKGVLYVTGKYGSKREDIFRALPQGDGFKTPERLGPEINSPGDEFNALIAPDESYLIFSSWGRKDGLGSADLYISFKNEAGYWMEALNMGRVNSPDMDYCPSLSRDRQYLFFTSNRSHPVSENKKLTYADLKHMGRGPGNGRGDIYWVDMSVVFSLKDQIEIYPY